MFSLIHSLHPTSMLAIIAIILLILCNGTELSAAIGTNNDENQQADRSIFIVTHSSLGHSLIPHRLNLMLSKKYQNENVNVHHIAISSLSNHTEVYEKVLLPMAVLERENNRKNTQRKGSHSGTSGQPLILLETFLLSSYDAFFSPRNLFSLFRTTNIVLLSIGMPSDSIWLPFLARNGSIFRPYPKELPHVAETQGESTENPDWHLPLPIFRNQPDSLKNNFLSYIHSDWIPFKELIASACMELLRVFHQSRHGKLDVVYFDAALGGHEVSSIRNWRNHTYRLSPMVEYAVEESQHLREGKNGATNSDEQEIISWMHSDQNKNRNRVIYISFGSRSHLEHSRLNVLLKLLEHFLSSRDEFLVLLQLNQPEQKASLLKNAQLLSNRVFVRRGWIDHSWLLTMSQVELWIHHGGFNSFMESIYYQIPSIAVPLNIDQFANAVRISTLQIGMNLDTRSGSDEDFVRRMLIALNVLFDQQTESLLGFYRDNLRHLAALFEKSHSEEERLATHLLTRLESNDAREFIVQLEWFDVAPTVGLMVFVSFLWVFGCMQFRKTFQLQPKASSRKQMKSKEKFLRQGQKL